jgi:hypothetical protein
MKRERQIYNALMKAVKEGCIPFGCYGPETCRRATPDEMRRFGGSADIIRKDSFRECANFIS